MNGKGHAVNGRFAKLRPYKQAMQIPDLPKVNAAGTGTMANAAHMWEFLDELSRSDPAEYQRFLAEQLAANSGPMPRMPDAAFCVRATTGTMRTPLWVNVCSHPTMKAPSSTPDGSVPIAVGVPRPAAVAAEKGSACDVVVACEVTDRALSDAGFREEVAALAMECVKDVLTTKRKLPGGERIQPGYRTLPHSRTAYAGELIAFVDARADEAPPMGSSEATAAAAGAAAAASGAALPAGFDDMLKQFAGMAGVDGGMGPDFAALAGMMGGAVGGGASGAGGGRAPGQTRAKPNEPCPCASGKKFKQCCGRAGGVLGARAVAAAAAGHVEPAEDEDALGELRLPGTGTAPTPAKAGGGAGGGGVEARRPLVEVVAETVAVAAVPSHSLVEAEGALVLRVEVPLLESAAELDVQLGDSDVALVAEGVYELRLRLPKQVNSDQAKCKFEKKKKRLTVTMPLRA